MKLLDWIRRNLTGVLGAVSVVLMVVVVLGLGGIVNRQHQSNLEFCARSNDARVSSIHNLRGDVHTLKAELALWEAVKAATPPSAEAQSPPAVAKAFDLDVQAIRRGISRKQHAVHSSISAQAPVAIHPGSPIVACSRAYP